MGQKVNPIGFRLAVNKDWRSKWYATGQDYATKLHEDLVMQQIHQGALMSAAVSSIVIERAWNSVRITVHTARPGLVIGRKGEEIEKIRQYLQGLCGASTQVNIDIVEIRSPETDAQLIAENVAVQLERRVSFRRAMKRAVPGGHGTRCRRYPASVAPAVSAAPTSLVPNGTAKAKCRCRLSARRSTTALPKPVPCTALSA